MRSNSNVACKKCLSHRDGPNMKIMHFNHTRKLQQPTLDFPRINLPWCALHQNPENVAYHFDRGCKNKNGKQKGANRVNKCPLWVVPNGRASNHHTYTLKKVPENM